MNGFIPKKISLKDMPVVYFEDAPELEIPGYRVREPVEYYQRRIRSYLKKLDAYSVQFIPGDFPMSPPREGYLITFDFNGIDGRIEAAALPLRSKTKIKSDRALAMALYLVGEWLKSEVYSIMFRPGALPLVPFLIGEGGKTITEALVENGRLPLLGGGS